MRASYWRGRRVFVTGHTGFKGAWLCLLLDHLGAETHGYALSTPAHFLFHRAKVAETLASDVRGDVRHQDQLQAAMEGCNPEIVLHMAAQTTVRGLRQPSRDVLGQRRRHGHRAGRGAVDQQRELVRRRDY